MGSMSPPPSSSGGSSLPSGSEGDILVRKDGSWQGSQTADLLAQSVTCTEALTGGSVYGGALTAIDGEDTAQVLVDSITMNEMEVSKANLAGLAASGATSGDRVALLSEVAAHPDALTPQGAFDVLPARMQTTGDTAFVMDSASKKFAVGFRPRIDIALDALSIYFKAVSVQGDLVLTLHDDATGYQADGALEDASWFLPIVMTANNAPSPYTVALINSSGTNADDGSHPAYYALLETPPTFSTSYYTQSGSSPSAGSPIYYTLDAGSGNSLVINAGWFLNAKGDAYFPTAFTLWGSNVASPTVNTDADWTQIGGSLTLTAPGLYYSQRWAVTNSTGYRHYRWKITAASGGGVVAFAMRLQGAASCSVPGTQLASLGSINSGASATTWVRGTFSPVQLSAGKKYWIVGTGSAGANYSASYNRVTTTSGSELQDNVDYLVATDGSTWKAPWVDARKFRCGINLVANSNPYHVPKLGYGRTNGKNLPVYEDSAWALKTIPEAGITLDLDGLTADAAYPVYFYDNSGTMALDASSTLPVSLDGIQVKTGATNRRLVGWIMPYTYLTGHVGPKDVRSARRVWNKYNRVKKALGRTNPYYALALTTEDTALYTAATLTTDALGNWTRVAGGIFDISFVTGEEFSFNFSSGGGSLDSGYGFLLYAMDGHMPSAMHSGWNRDNSSNSLHAQGFNVKRGAHFLYPVYQSTGGRIIRWFGTPSNTQYMMFGCYGEIEA